MENKNRLIILGLLGLIVVGGLTYANRGTILGTRDASPTPTAPDGRELVGEIPENARDIDEFALVTDDFIYFRSITSSSTLKIPNGDPETFVRLTDFMTYPDARVATECSGAGTYAYYGDAKHVYFYQVWRVPDFKHSKIEIISDEPKSAFSLTSTTQARVGDELFTITPIYSTTTCSYDIEA